MNGASDILEAEGAEVLVLTSGGVDSAACIDFYIEFGRKPCALFVDYGQAASVDEARAAASIAAHYQIDLRVAKWRGLVPKGVGPIPARNLFLIASAAMELPPSATVICIGVHSGTNYPDCSEEFLGATQRALLESGQHRIQIAAPFVSWSKGDIFQYCKERAVPINLTYSCENAGGPCGKCLSCEDRRWL